MLVHSNHRLIPRALARLYLSRVGLSAAGASSQPCSPSMGLLHTLSLPPVSFSKSSLISGELRPLLLSHGAGFSSAEAACGVQNRVSSLHISRISLNKLSSSAMEEVTTSRDGQEAESKTPLIVVSFYKFANLPDYEQMRAPLKELCEANFVSGGIILAEEGINGSLCGTREAVEVVMSTIQSDKRLAHIRRTEAPAGLDDEEIHNGHSGKSPLGAGENAPFRWDHVRVKLKKEIVSMGLPGVNPAEQVGKYVKPKDWNKLISDPNTVVVDVRNSYEIRVGKFKGAVDPETDSFRQFPAWVDENLTQDGVAITASNVEEQQTEKVSSKDKEDAIEPEQPRSPRRIAMYCTGGIRCEKATSLLVTQGFDEVYHLEGGILKYLEETPPSESLWEGECFVFDKRVAVGHRLQQGSYRLCYACKKPVNSTDMESPLWEEGVSCPYCFHGKSEPEKTRARARHEQFLHWGVIGGPNKGRAPPPSKPRLSEYPERDHYFSLKSS